MAKQAEYTNRIESLLWDAGYRKDAGKKRGWYLRYSANGPPGLTDAERRINDAGGVFYGKDALEVLKQEVLRTREYLGQLEPDIMSQSDYWLSDWVKEAKTIILLANNGKAVA